MVEQKFYQIEDGRISTFLDVANIIKGDKNRMQP